MKAILTVIGKDKPGIIAKVSALLAEENVNIEDISQTVIQSNFTMIMVVDISKSKTPLDGLVQKFNTVGKEMGVEIYVKHEDIYNAMYTV